jgi:flagellar biosynthesis protein FlhG
MKSDKNTISQRSKKQRAKIITVSGGKGGVGKTFFAVNLGVELKKRGFRVLIFDADINLSNVNLLLNIDAQIRFSDFLETKKDIGELIQRGVGGVDALYAGGDLDRIFHAGDEEVHKITERLYQLEIDYDYIVIDTQAGLNEWNVGLMTSSDRNILVTNPEFTALVDMYKVIKIVSREHTGMHFEIVVNKAFSPQNAAGVFKNVSHTVSQFGLKTKLSFLGYITEDSKRVIESIQKRVPIVVLHETGEITECIKLITNVFLKNQKSRRRASFFYGLLGI